MKPTAWLVSATLLSLACFTSVVLAEDYYIDITNKTGHTITHLYVSPESASDWEEDVLGEDVLRNHKARRVKLNGYPSPIFDVRAVDADGDTYTFWKIDVAKEDLIVTLDDID